MGASARADFLSQYDPQVLPYLLAFADQLSSTDCDVLMFTARKAACLFDAMRSVGLVTPVATVVSDRILDMDLDWLSGKRVVLVDDVLITGSTLYKQKLLLKKAGAEEVKLLVLAVNIDGWNEDLARPDFPCLELGEAEALSLCSQIVDSFSLIPRPYNLDWPLIDGIRADENDLIALQGLPGWRMQDTRSALQVSEDILNISQWGSSRVRERLSKSVGIDLRGLQMAKIRIYGRRTDEQGGPWAIRVLPMISMSAQTFDDADRLFSHLTSGLEAVDVRSFTTVTSRAKFAQFAISVYLVRLWLADFESVSGMHLEVGLEDNQLAFAFPPSASNAFRSIVSLAQGSTEIRTSWDKTNAQHVGILENTNSEKRKVDLMEIQAMLTAPFIDLYDNKEKLAREELLRRGPQAFDDPLLEELLDRLNRGYTFAQLNELISPRLVGSALRSDQIVSAFLDIAIDHGVIVPIMQATDGVVRRAFRHGEDIKFAENEPRLFAEVISAAMRVGKRTTIPKLHVEKLFVIYLRIGLALRDLNLWTGRLGRVGTVGVRWDLKGAVVQVNPSGLFGAHTGDGLADHLVSMGLLVRNAHGDGYGLGVKIPGGSTRATDLAHAEKIGSLFGKLLYAKGGAGKLSDNEITLLASIDSLPSTMGALAAEISIIASGWAGYAYRLRHLNSSDPAANEAALARSDIYEASNSGSWKYLSFREKVPDQIIQRIEKELDDPIYRAEWVSYWPSTTSNVAAAAPQLFDLATRLGRWLLAIDVYLKCIRSLLALAADDGPTSQKLFIQAVERASEHRAYAGETASAPSDFVNTIQSELDAERLDVATAIRNGLDRIDVLIGRSEGLLDSARASVRLYGEAKDVLSFSHALRIRWSGPELSTRDFDPVYSEIVRKAIIAGRPRKVALAEIDSTDSRASERLLIARSERGVRALAGIAGDVLRAAPPGVSIRARLLLDLAEHEQAHSSSQGGGYYWEGLGSALDSLEQETPSESLPDRSIAIVARPSVRVSGGSRIQRVIDRVLADFPDQVEKKVLSENRTLEVRTLPAKSGPPHSRADIGIVTVIEEESRAVRNWLQQGQEFSEYPGRDGAYFYESTLVLAGVATKIVLTQALGQGNSSVMVAFDRLHEQFYPKLSVLLGIAGSIHPKARLGYVVVGDQIVDYGPVALTSEGPKHRGQAYRMSAKLTGAFNHFFTIQGEETEIAMSTSAPQSNAGHPREESFRIRRGAIGSGYAVVKYDQDPIRNWLEGFTQKALVLETESSGTATYFYEQLDSLRSSAYFVIRGVSDNADQLKDDAWKFAASENAVTALGMILEHLRPALVE